MITGVSESYGQLYKTGVGARLGAFSGLTVKHFVQEDQAVEGILSGGIGWGGLGGFVFTGLYEFQRPFADVPNLEWYFGGGGHLGLLYDGEDILFGGVARSVAGLDLIIGVEYTFDEFPFSAGLDWKPVFNIVGPRLLWGDIAALSIRYTIR